MSDPRDTSPPAGEQRPSPVAEGPFAPLTRLLARVGLVGLVTPFLVALILAADLRMMFTCGANALLAPSTTCLVELGGNLGRAGPFLVEGQWWRLATAMFLHIGLLHLGFNLMALTRIGPEIESVFGTGRTLAAYLITGLVGNWFSATFGHYGVAAGASGAIMGLIGMAAGWGQRNGGEVGIRVRNDMLKWAGYTMVFGLVAHVDNWAHGGGFVAGALFGYLVRPTWLNRGARSRADLALASVSALVAIAIVGMIVIGATRSES